MPLTAGQRLGPYEIIGALGAGGMGEVYRARDPRIGREVAIKVLPPGVTAEPDRLARFQQEARAAGALNHPNLLVVFDLGTHDGSPYLVTELLEGETLRERLQRDRVPQRKAVDWAAQLADAAAAAHERGVLHRDIKPENVFLTRDDRVKLLDFGLAKLLYADPSAIDEATRTRQTDPGAVLGTPGYMSPEQVRGEPIDERSDIFALGIVLAEMLTGTHPFHQATRVETMTAILQKDVALPESLPPGLLRIVERMLSKRAGSRFQSMKDVAFALHLLSGSGTTEASGVRRPAGRGADAAHDFVALTFRRGRIGGARFTPDGSIVYGAAWEGSPVEIFTSRPGTPEARAVGLSDADLHAVSPTGELAVSLGRRYRGGWVATGTLARIPLGGGAPRRVAERVLDADWAPDGKSFAIIRHAEDGSFALEYPIGKRLHASGGWLSNVRFSRDGRHLACIHHRWFGDDAGRPIVVDLEGRVVMDGGADLSSTGGLAWSPNGDEVWVGGDRDQRGRDIIGYDMTGTSRIVLTAPGQMTLCDVAADGRMVIAHDHWRREVYSGPRSGPVGQNLAWFDWPFLSAISRDGSHILFEEQRAVTGGNQTPIYLRPVDGGPAMHLGDGRARGISPDGAWVCADSGLKGRLVLIPTGIGEPREVQYEGLVELLWWSFFPDGKRMVVLGSMSDASTRAIIVPLDGGRATPIPAKEFGWPLILTPDGRAFAAPGSDDRIQLYSIESGEATPLPGATAGEWPLTFSPDGRHLYVYPRGRTSLAIDRIDVATGERTSWVEIKPADRAGVLDIFPVWITPDGEHYAYSYRRCLSDLFLVVETDRR